MTKSLVTILLFLLLTACNNSSSLSHINKMAMQKFDNLSSIGMLGGMGPGAKYEMISVSGTVNKPLTFENGRREILELMDLYIEEINKDKRILEIFVVPQVDRQNIHLSLTTSPETQMSIGSWEIAIIGTRVNEIVYMSDTTIDGDWNIYKLSEETYDEACKIAYGCPPFERIVTYTKFGRRNVPIELHGPWGFCIQRIVIKQIQSGEFIYYAEIDGQKCKLAVNGEQIVVEATGTPISEIFPPLPAR